MTTLVSIELILLLIKVTLFKNIICKNRTVVVFIMNNITIGGSIMGKFTISFLVFLCISVNIIGLTPAFAADNIFKQGIYGFSDFNTSVSNSFTVSNPAPTTGMFLIIFDKNVNVLEAIRIVPNLEKFDLMPILPDYRILIIGKGELHFAPNKS